MLQFAQHRTFQKYLNHLYRRRHPHHRQYPASEISNTLFYCRLNAHTHLIVFFLKSFVTCCSYVLQTLKVCQGLLGYQSTH